MQNDDSESESSDSSSFSDTSDSSDKPPKRKHKKKHKSREHKDAYIRRGKCIDRTYDTVIMYNVLRQLLKLHTLSALHF